MAASNELIYFLVWPLPETGSIRMFCRACGVTFKGGGFGVRSAATRIAAAYGLGLPPFEHAVMKVGPLLLACPSDAQKLVTLLCVNKI